MARTDKQTNRQMDMATLRPIRPRGAELVKIEIMNDSGWQGSKSEKIYNIKMMELDKQT